MVVSRVYRGSAGDDVKAFRFRSFGDPEAPAAAAPAFELPSFAEPIAPKMATSTPEAAPLNLPQLLEEAVARGRKEGLATAEERFESTSTALAKALVDVSRLRESLAQNGTQDMLRLVMAVAEQVVRHTIEVDPKVIVSIIETALQASVRADSYRISINPADLEVVNAQKPLFMASISGLQNLSIVTDGSISRGGCRVDSELGDVDATIESQLGAIRQALSDATSEA